METDQGPLEEVVSLIRAAGTDTRTVEAKASVNDLPKGIWSTVSSFSNGTGGVILLGLDESNGFKPAPGFDASRIQDKIADAFRPRGVNEGPGPVTPTPRGTIDIAIVDESPVVVVEVLEASTSNKPTYVTAQGPDGGTYERTGDGNRKLGRYAVHLMASDVHQPLDDRQPVPGTSIDSLDETAVARFIQRIQRRRPRAVEGLTSQIDILRRFNAVDENSVPTLAGLLTLGRYPQEAFPQLVVSFNSYPGTSKASIVGDTRMLDRRTLDGTIPDMIDDSVRAVADNLRLRRISRGAGAEDVPEIPIDAIREVITNSLAHRDYGAWAQGAQVRIELFPDRLEVVNPGGIWGGRGVADLLDGESRSRNAVLATLLTETPFRDRDETVSENAGSGIQRMIGSLGRQGLAAPRFNDSRVAMTVTLDRHGLMDPEMDDWLAHVGAAELPADQKRILALVHAGRLVDDQLVEAQLGVSRRDARSALDSLVRHGWLTYPRAVGAGYEASSVLHDAETLGGDLLEIFHEVSEVRGISLEERIIDALRQESALSIHELAEQVGASVNSIRTKLRVLVDQGVVWPTALPQSRNRKYVLNRAPRQQ